MDGLTDNQPEAEPTVQIVRTGFFTTKKRITVFATSLSIIILVILVIILNYLDIVSLSQLQFLPKKFPANAVGTPIRLTLIPQASELKAGDLTLNCPVESAFCKSQKLINLNKQDAIFYKAAAGSTVSASLKIPSLENIAISIENSGKKYFYESVISKDGSSCYTIAYTLPSDAVFGNILSLPFLDSLAVATLGTKILSVEGNEGNLIIQVRNTPMDPGTPCSLIKKNPEFFKSF